MSGHQIPLQHQRQQAANDCWATCLAIICQYRNVSLTREQIWVGAPTAIGGGYKYGEKATCAEANKCIKTLSSGRITFELLFRKKLTYDNFVSYTTQQRVVMLAMKNHMWLVSGYNAKGQLLIHNVAKMTGPEPAGRVTVIDEMRDTMVLNLRL